MKKLGKLNLTAEKMLGHEELISFRGGSGSCSDQCHTSGPFKGCRICVEGGYTWYLCDCDDPLS